MCLYVRYVPLTDIYVCVSESVFTIRCVCVFVCSRMCIVRVFTKLVNL